MRIKIAKFSSFILSFSSDLSKYLRKLAIPVSKFAHNQLLYIVVSLPPLD